MNAIDVEANAELRELASKVGYAFWRQNFMLQNDGASDEQVLEAWMEVRDTQIGVARRAMAALEKNGFIVTTK